MKANLMIRLWHDRHAVAAVEMALVATVILVPVTAFMVEAGQAILTQYKLTRGLHAGLMYAWAVPSNASASNIQTAAINGFQTTNAGSYGSLTPTATASFTYYCIDPTVGTPSGAAVTATTTCSGTSVLATYVTLGLTASIPTIFPLYKGSASWPLSVTGTVRI